MMSHSSTDTEVSASKAVDLLYHSWITGLVLSLITRKNAKIAEEFVFRLFRKQHLERFLPGLKKLGLDAEPHAQAAAKYHYFSNQLGGVKVEYFAESSTKAWVRYPPPRWIWEGTAICGIPSEVNRAMLRGWHAHNGVSLDNPRLGFVCTKTTAEGQPGLEGYYQEFPHPLSPEERLQYKPEESCPRIEPGSMPELDALAWPEARQAKAAVNYSMEYIRNALPILVALLGPEEALLIGRICGRQIGMHCYDQVAELTQVQRIHADDFIAMLAKVFSASGDKVEIFQENGVSCLARTKWRLFPDADTVLEAIWLAPFEGLLAVHDRFLTLSMDRGKFKVTASQG
ncbi:MAG: hypothetical protein KUG75_07560 [Pseudomonadales bacterium]|nr:hypothetical protein [Pseudomonadales bacterium]